METVTVWAARLGSPDEGVKGSLTLGPDQLSFASDRGDMEVRIPLSDVRRVRRIHGSPVMVVERTGAVVAFYFAQPPPVIGAGRPFQNRKERSSSLTYLADTNTVKRADIKRWVGEIKQAARRARG